MNTYEDWFYDDMTWCIADCEQTVCPRNKKLMRNPVGIHSFSDFRGTDMCFKTIRGTNNE